MNGYVAILLSAIIFGFLGILIHYNHLMFGEYFQVMLRNAGALLLLIPILFWRQIRLSFDRKTFITLLAYATVLTFSFSFINLALLATDIKDVLATRYLVTIFLSVVITLWFLNEKIRTINIVAMSLALLGIAMFMFPHFNFLASGIIYAALAAGTFTIGNLIIKNNEHIKPEQLMLFEFGTISFLLGLFILITNQPTITGFSWLALIASAVFSVLLIVVTYLLIYGFRNTNFNLANIVFTSEIFFGLLFGYLFLKQTINLTEGIGISLIFLAAILPNIVSLCKKKTSQST